jgi:molybdate transport repressor ModE-like protein
MRIIPTLGWKVAGKHDEPLDARLLPLLEAIAASASLAAAVVECGISYRAAWGLLREYRQKVGAPLVLLERGRGASLTASGEQLIRAQATATQRLARILPDLATDVGPPPRPEPRFPELRLRVAASHDLALAALSETLPEKSGIALELSVMGSLHALREFAEGRADVAGFHVPIDRHATWDRAPFLRWLRARRDTLVRFVDRDQGLILARGNPAHVRNLRDVADGNLRFVNRQRGSGTRLLIDRMIADENIDASALNRSGHEEFTHPAVAATVASGGADAGFGLRAAAAEYGLAFVPLVRERYFLAVRSKDVDKPAIARLIDALRSPAFARHVHRFPGYQPAAAGSFSGLEALAPIWPRPRASPPSATPPPDRSRVRDTAP